MPKNNIYVDIHALQVLPPNNINRDDTGSPKTAIYGGVPRARISSQAWKRAMRGEFKKIFDAEDLGSRTLRAVEMVASEIENLSKDTVKPVSQAEAVKMAETALTSAGIKVKEAKKESAVSKTEALLFISHKQARQLAELAVAGEKDKKAYKAALQENPSIDIALFGRMVASEPLLNLDATCQVAHAISTHKVETEYDYFTAVDDLNTDEETGAGHIGNTEFSSSVVYRYATINVRELQKSLGLQTEEAVLGFLKAFIYSMPTGKQNSFANRTIPAEIYISVREDLPLSFAGAFEEPVRQTNGGYAKESAHALEQHAKNLYETFDLNPKMAVSVGTHLDLGENMTLPQALEAVGTALHEELATEES